MQNAKLITVWGLIIAGFFAISYWTIYAYKYATTTTIEDVTKKVDLFEKAKSDLVQAKLEYCYDNRLDSEKCEEVMNGGWKLTWTGKLAPTTSEPPSQKWYTAKHSLILTWSHDYRVYKDRNGAVWRNNNPSGLTWWVSNTLKWLWKENWIEFSKWTLRPKNEKGNYILFSSIEHGLRAKVIAIRERWWKATVKHFLGGWWTDYVKLSFSTEKIISELTEEEFAELFIQQMKKESPWLVSQLVKDWILIINP